MDLAKVMDELAEALEAIPSLAGRVYPFPNEAPPEPSAIVAYPEQINYHATKARGLDGIDLDVVVYIGAMTDRATRDNAVGYSAGSGPESVLAALEGHDYSACDSVQVRTCEFDTHTVAKVNHLALIFTLDIIGPGNTE